MTTTPCPLDCSDVHEHLKVLDSLAATLVSVGVNMGDHGETVWRAVEVGPDETVRSLLERLIPAGSRYTLRQYDNYVRLSFAQPLPEKGPDDDVF